MSRECNPKGWDEVDGVKLPLITWSVNVSEEKEMNSNTILPVESYFKNGEEYTLDRAQDGKWLVTATKDKGTAIDWSEEFDDEDEARSRFEENRK